MIETSWIVGTGILLALAFDFGNGLNDAANAISTIVATRVLSLRAAVLLSAFFNFVAAFVFSTAVAETMGKGVVDPAAIDGFVVIAGLISSVVWVYGLSWLGLPISASHSLVGGLVGASVAAAGWGVVQSAGLMKILAFIFFAPVLGLIFGYAFSLVVRLLIKSVPPGKIQEQFRRLQLISVSVYSLGHGANDAQKTMGIITLLLFTGGYISDFHVPAWVVFASHTTIALGTLAGGWAVVKTMGTQITKLRPIDGFCAETAGAGVIIGSSMLGIPVSTTHVITGSISGVGTLNRTTAVNWSIAKRIMYAWFLTIPLTALAAAAVYFAMNAALGI
ncbi:MAG: inorganic phosphate transporter [Candidatus Micrarchaeota archaeon]